MVASTPRINARRGGVLFEVMLSVALFGGAAAFTIGAVRSVYMSLERVRLQQEAVDLAASKLAELEAGLITLADLRSDSTLGAADQPHLRQEWTFDLRTSRTMFRDLTLVELTVRQDIPDTHDETNPIAYTLRQLIALRGADANEAEVGDE